MSDERFWMLRFDVSAHMFKYPELRERQIEMAEMVMRDRYPVGENEVRLVGEWPYMMVETGEQILVEGDHGDNELIPEFRREECPIGIADYVMMVFEAKEDSDGRPA